MNFIGLSVLLLSTVAVGFEVDRGTTLNHQEITKRAFLNVTVQACRDQAQTEGRTFSAPAEPYTIENVLAACEAKSAVKSFYQSIKLIQNYNIKVDKSIQYTSSGHHFHNEAFNDGRDIIAVGLGAVKAANKKGNYQTSKKLLGKITHSLQDFYSHSNWIEIGKDAPNANLLKGDGIVGNIADETKATCRSCSENNCDNNILEDIISEQTLTSGYFALAPSTTKPTGKCSHGGAKDGSSTVGPTGGINKDKPDSSHGQFHDKAADMAITATSELLEDIRSAAGESAFLQMIGANPGRPLCFVIDTTGSMGDEILVLQELTSMIINNALAGVQQPPSSFILVEFKDPIVGPLIRTTDPEEFKRAIYSLSASGGGDLPEMSLTGLQMALNGAPPGSDIFLFTDAPAKDALLKSNLFAVIEQKKSVVNVILSGVLGSLSDYQVYEDLALASGGRLIRIPKDQLPLASDIVFDSSASSLVTLLEEDRKPGKSENFTFLVDDTTNKVMVYVTGATSSVTFVNPSSDVKTKAAVTESSSSVGNLQRIRLMKEVGLWQMQVVSDNPYTVKVVGESQLDFIYDFLAPAQGPLGGMIAHDSRPKAGKGNMELTLIGSEAASVTEVYLLETGGTGQVKGTVTNLDSNEYLVEFDNMPNKPFSLLVKGSNNGNIDQSTTSTFQRLSPGKIKTSSLLVTADPPNGIIEPGQTISIPFSVSSENPGAYTIQATNDQGYNVVHPSRLELTGGRADGKVQLTAPVNAQSGTEVTLLIEAQAPGGNDMNYAIMSFTVLKKTTDFSSPVCEVVSQSGCSETCSSSSWQVNFHVNDGQEGTGIDTIRCRQCKGRVIKQVAVETAKHIVTYEDSCCSTQVEMVVVDNVGNVGSCIFSTQKENSDNTVSTTTSIPQETAMSMSPKLVQSSLLWLILSLLVIHCNM